MGPGTRGSEGNSLLPVPTPLNNVSQISEHDRSQDGPNVSRASVQVENKVIRNSKEQFAELAVSQEKELLESKLLLKKKAQFTIKQPFLRTWYDSADRKFLK